MKVYIAGPMTGIDNFNRDAFHAKSDELSKEGHSVLNPASLPSGLTQGQYMDICFAMIRACDTIIMLNGWERSSGATAEYYYAKKLELDIIFD